MASCHLCVERFRWTIIAVQILHLLVVLLFVSRGVITRHSHPLVVPRISQCPVLVVTLRRLIYCLILVPCTISWGILLCLWSA